MIESGGYIKRRQPHHPAACDGYVWEHRLIVEGVIGRFLTPDEVVHHVDGDKKNNKPENLQVMSSGEHLKLHSERKKGIKRGPNKKK